jgi:hypothetical protein
VEMWWWCSVWWVFWVVILGMVRWNRLGVLMGCFSVDKTTSFIVSLWVVHILGMVLLIVIVVLDMLLVRTTEPTPDWCSTLQYR